MNEFILNFIRKHIQPHLPLFSYVFDSIFIWIWISMCIVTFLLQMIDTDLLKRTHQTIRREREKKSDELSTTSQSAGCPNIQPNNKKNRMKMHFVWIDNWLCDRGHIAMMHHDCAIFLVKRLKIQMLHNANQSNKHQHKKIIKSFGKIVKCFDDATKNCTHIHQYTHVQQILFDAFHIHKIYLSFVLVPPVRLFTIWCVYICYFFCAIVFGQIHVHLQLYKFWLFFFSLFFCHPYCTVLNSMMSFWIYWLTQDDEHNCFCSAHEFNETDTFACGLSQNDLMCEFGTKSRTKSILVFGQLEIFSTLFLSVLNLSIPASCIVGMVF